MSSREGVFGNILRASVKSSSRVGILGGHLLQSKLAWCRNASGVSRTDCSSDSWTDDLIACAICSGLNRAASCSVVVPIGNLIRLVREAESRNLSAV
jgi:hypothetical protein